MNGGPLAASPIESGESNWRKKSGALVHHVRVISHQRLGRGVEAGVLFFLY